MQLDSQGSGPCLPGLFEPCYRASQATATPAPPQHQPLVFPWDIPVIHQADRLELKPQHTLGKRGSTEGHTHSQSTACPPLQGCSASQLRLEHSESPSLHPPWLLL